MLGELIERIRRLRNDPRGYWSDIDSGSGDFAELFWPHVAIFAALHPLSTLIAGIIGNSHYGSSFFAFRAMGGFLLATVLGYAANIAIWVGLSYLIEIFAHPFGAARDHVQSVKLSLGAMIPIWLSGVVGLIPLPGLVPIAGLIAFGYGCYLLYIGLPLLSSAPRNKAASYVAAVMAISFVLWLTAFGIVGCIYSYSMI